MQNAHTIQRAEQAIRELLEKTDASEFQNSLAQASFIFNQSGIEGRDLRCFQDMILHLELLYKFFNNLN